MYDEFDKVNLEVVKRGDSKLTDYVLEQAFKIPKRIDVLHCKDISLNTWLEHIGYHSNPEHTTSNTLIGDTCRIAFKCRENSGMTSHSYFIWDGVYKGNPKKEENIYWDWNVFTTRYTVKTVLIEKYK